MEKSKSAVRRGRDKAESTIDEASAALRSETTGTTTTY
jgi:hypothetical protein